MPLWRLLGGHDAQVRAYAGGIDLQFPIEQLLEQTRGNLDNWISTSLSYPLHLVSEAAMTAD